MEICEASESNNSAKKYDRRTQLIHRLLKIRVDEAVNDLLIGEAPSDDLFNKAADQLLKEAKGQGSNDFKIPLTRRTLRAVLREATGMGDAR